MFAAGKLIFVVLLTLLCSTVLAAEGEKLKPFVLASSPTGEMSQVLEQTRKKLTDGGFDIIGQYSPYPGATVIGITNNVLKQAAAKTDFGIFAAAQRVTLTRGKDGKLQVAYTNPRYFANAYRLEDDLAGVSAALKQALGAKQTFGSKEGLTAKELQDYHYKWLMPYFDDRLDLASYSSYQTAVKAVETALAAGKGGAKKIYRVDIAEKNTSLFGVHIGSGASDECASDKYIMDAINFTDLKATGHLPYEIVVKDNKVYALKAEFRIAISFPDLAMMGSNSFSSIMCAPSAFELVLTEAAGGELEEEE